MNDRKTSRTCQPADIPSPAALVSQADAPDGIEQATGAPTPELQMTWPSHYPEAGCFLAWPGDRPFWPLPRYRRSRPEEYQLEIGRRLSPP